VQEADRIAMFASNGHFDPGESVFPADQPKAEELKVRALVLRRVVENAVGYYFTH
jgi:hypothetical protein